MDKIKVSVAGLSANEKKRGVFALFLKEDDGERQLPIVIAMPEARSIIDFLQTNHIPNIRRPNAHNLIKSIVTGFRIKPHHVLIYKLEEGLFFTQILLHRKGKEVILNARPSDAVAIALEVDIPIFVTKELMDTAGVRMDKKTHKIIPKVEKKRPPSLSELQNSLEKAIEEEDYERAAKIRDEINKQKNQSV